MMWLPAVFFIAGAWWLKTGKIWGRMWAGRDKSPVNYWTLTIGVLLAGIFWFIVVLLKF
jgi:hypothetical protein